MKKLITLLLIIIFLIPLVQAVDFSPQGNINLKNRYQITNWPAGNCSVGQVVKGILGNGTWSCATNAAAADTNFSTICSAGEYGDGDGNCYSFNTSVNSAVVSSTSDNYTSGDGNITIVAIGKTISFSSAVAGWINGLIDNRVTQALVSALGFYTNTETDASINNNVSSLRGEMNLNIENNVTVLDAEDVSIRASIILNESDDVTIGSSNQVILSMNNVSNLVGVSSCASDEKPTNLTINNSGVFLTCATDLNTGSGGGGNISGGGTTNYMVMWANTQNITNSPAFVTAQDDVNFTNAIVVGTTSTANLGAIRTNNADLQFYNGTAWVSVSAGGGAADTTCEDSICVLSDDTGYLTTNLDFTGHLSANNCAAGTVVKNVSVNSTGIYVNCVTDIDTLNVQGLNVSTNFGGDVSGVYNTMSIDTTGGLSTLNITSGTFADARISQSSVTQHQAALSITESQVSDLQSYITNNTDVKFSTVNSTGTISMTYSEFIENSTCSIWRRNAGGAITEIKQGSAC